MTKGVVWHPGAKADVSEAQEWYESRSEHAAGLFETELDFLVTRIREAPKMFPVAVAGMRRAVFASLPYSIFFEESLLAIEIFAVAHAKRRLGYWLGRL